MSSFSDILQNLIQQSGIKYATIAEAVQYDLSYVSKWANGKTLPAEKNAESIITRIVSCIVDETSEENIRALCKVYSCAAEDLHIVLHDTLIDGYQASKSGKQKENVYTVEMPTVSLAKKIKKHIGDSKTIALIDLLALDHESRLILAGIVNGQFSVKENPNSRYNLILSVQELGNEDIIYNTIFLIHMMTSLSGLDFRIYSNAAAQGKVLFSSQNQYSVTAVMFPGEKQLVSVVETEDRKTTDLLYQRVKGLLSQEQQVFSDTTIQELLSGNEYIRSMISTNIKWLIGHITEHFLPDDVFEELLNNTSFYDKCELRKLHNLSQSILEQPNTFITIYESAFSNLAINGELDFYNHKVNLTIVQRKRVLEYLIEMINVMQIRMIDSYLSVDFQHISNPCMFLSDTVCYLRLENGKYKNNIKMLNAKNVKISFDKFYHEIWNNRQDVVIADKEKITAQVQHYCSQLNLMTVME